MDRSSASGPTRSGLFDAIPLGGLLPLSFQLLLKNLRGDTFMNLRKVVQWQRRDHRSDVEVDPLHGKHPAGVELMNETRFGNGRGHAPVGQTNREGNLH